MANEEKIEPSHEIFISEYMKDFNGTRAYLVAYPESSPESARTSASRLLTKDNIKKIISEKAKEILEKSDVEMSKVIQRYKEIAFADIRDVLSWGADGKISIKNSDEIPINIIESIQENKDGSLRFKTYCALNALDSLSKYYGLYKDGQSDVNVNIVYLDKDDEKI